MSEPSSAGSLLRYYCTVGNGMEPFLMDEVKRKLVAEHVCQMPGKVLFSSSVRINRICGLKAAERLFLLLKQDAPVQLSVHTSPAKAASILQSRLLGDRNQWTSAVLTWSRLQVELASRRTTDIIPSTDLGGQGKKEGRGDQEQREEEEEKCRMEARKTTTQQTEKGRESRRLTTGGENGAPTLEKKRKREKEICIETQTLEKKTKREDEEWEEGRRGGGQDSSSDKTLVKGKTSERERSEGGEGREMVVTVGKVKPGTDFSGGSAAFCDHATGGPDNNVDSGSRGIKDCAVDSVENVRSIRGEDKMLLEPKLPSCFPVSFRISCKCTGSVSRLFSTQETSKVIGVGLSRLLGWKADLKNPKLEVNVNLSDDHCLLGIPLTRLPLANRSYIKTTGLRSTIAWAMASLAQIQPGFFVVDPMCGVGTILIEAAQEHKDGCFLGVDIDDGQLQRANENVEFAKLGNRIHLLKASSMVLPLPSASVDVVVCDLPFGRKFGTKTQMSANLPVIVTEMERILCIGGTLVLLLTPQLSVLLKKLLAQTSTGSTSNEETKPQTGLKDCPCPPLSSTKQQTFQIHQGVKSSSAQPTDPQPELKHSLPPPPSSLKHQATMRVSLGAMDGLIHKYVKIDA